MPKRAASPAPDTIESREPFPPASDPRWEAWSAPIYRWLGDDCRGRTWAEIHEWSASSRGVAFARQCLAWLETLGTAEAFRLYGEWRWRRVSSGGKITR